jgi:hypothetical protein
MLCDAGDTTYLPAGLAANYTVDNVPVLFHCSSMNYYNQRSHLQLVWPFTLLLYCDYWQRRLLGSFHVYNITTITNNVGNSRPRTAAESSKPLVRPQQGRAQGHPPCGQADLRSDLRNSCGTAVAYWHRHNPWIRCRGVPVLLRLRVPLPAGRRIDHRSCGDVQVVVHAIVL